MPNFKSENPGTWFYFNPDNESAGGVCLRELSVDEVDRIERLTVKTKKKVSRGVVVEDKKEDIKMASRLRWDFCIVDWSEVSLDGKQLDCTTENKVKMMKVTDFVKFIVDSLNELVEANESLEKARLKNSKSSSDGSLENPIAESA